MPGLGKDWWRVIKVLDRLSCFYDDLNTVISLGKDKELRRVTARNLGNVNGVVLDAGAGNGAMTKAILAENPNVSLIVMLDFLPKMLKNANVERSICEKVVGVFEAIPLRNGSVDGVVMAFSLRDAYDMNVALQNVKRVMKSHGRLVILELGKPDNVFKKFLVALYWRFISPMLAFIRLGRKGLLAYEIYPTYTKMPDNRKFINLMKTFFKDVNVEKKMLDGILLISASHG
ncbi:MAG: class I SAM-dependent methyltransferase [Nitrososphaerota archaeon]|nr:class I SAM-dependent methyltransferase [Aigarchaeota archaeon]MDW8077174.1 class I SAM-dependent methyltransferase [Nitrososphaerota archaeon]